MVISGEEDMAAVVLYASLFEPPLNSLSLGYLPKSHAADAPDILNVLRVLDMPQALAMAARGSLLSQESLAKMAGSFRLPLARAWLG